MSVEIAWNAYYRKKIAPGATKPLGWNPRHVFEAGFSAGIDAASEHVEAGYAIRQVDGVWELRSSEGALWGGFDTHAEAIDYMDWLIANPDVIERARTIGRQS